jgi:hypothetical protein
MRSTVWTRFVRTSVLLSLAALGLATVVSAKPAPDRPRRRALNLFASSGLLLEANRLQCGIDNVGQVCVAFSGSPVGGGGFWPKGTHDQYIFNSGLQLAAVVDPAAGFAWAGDTAGAWFFDPRGDQASGDPLGSIYNSLDPVDFPSAWPLGAKIRDAAIYDEALLGQPKISDGDSWVRYWEGNPIQLGGREHPMGIMVEQRSMAWNFPAGNEDILYFVFTFYNVTASDESVYAGLDPEIRSEIAAIGQQFQELNETKFTLNIPNAGYTLTNLYAAFAMDADVAVFDHNYSTAFLPFNIGSTYSGDFLPEVGWTFPSAVFGKPFFPGPGFIGVKYLKSPESSPGVQIGLTMFSNNTNGGAFPDAVGDHLLYRRLSGFLGLADIQCNSSSDPAVARSLHLCYLAQTRADSRFYQSSGPFDLAPGQAATIVVAYIQAAPVDVPGIAIGGDNAPGIPATGDTLFVNPSRVRLIDKVAGWVSASDANGNSRIDQAEVVTTPGSLLNKALVAQAVFDAKFLLPNAPAAPQFFLVPGDNAATVVWQKSSTEDEVPCVGAPPVSGVCGGDLYFNIASRPYNIDTTRDSLGAIISIDSTRNALYDPNFRQFDVEGYRIYRGRTSSELTLLAQFDYTGTQFIDYTGAIAYGDLNGDGIVQCAPELGLQADCPTFPPGFDTTFVKAVSYPTELTGEIIQVKSGDRVELANGDVLNLVADTAVIGGGSGFPGLTNSGIAFAYTDNNVRNGFTYQYTVTAFDVNSAKSGPTSLESARITKGVTPRSPSGQEVAGTLAAPELIGGDNSVLNPAGAVPTIDPVTGIFSGLQPPTNALEVGLAAFLPQLLGSGNLTVRIDSIVPGYPEFDFNPGRAKDAIFYMTGQGAGAPVQFTVGLPAHQFTVNQTGAASFQATAIDSAKSARFGGNQTFSLYGQVTLTSVGAYRATMFGRADINNNPANSSFNGPRWWSGATNENTPNPNGGSCHPSVTSCVSAAPTNTVGAMPGVDIFEPRAYNTVPNNFYRRIEPLLATLVRAADFKVYWGTGKIDSVVDVTHRVRVPFSPQIRASWGLVTQASFAATTQALTGDGKNNLLTWSDILCVGESPALTARCGGAAQIPAVLDSVPTLTPIAVAASTEAGTASLAATGNGFIFYLAGHFFLMQMAALPTAGTVWNARTYTGTVTGTAAAGDFAYTPDVRPAPVPGLRVRVAYTGSTLNPATTTAANMKRIHTVPDPYYVTNSLEASANQKVLNFVNLPAQAIVRIYSLSGVLVNVLTHDDPTGGGLLTWNLRNRNNQFVASGVYFYHVESPDGQTKVGRFTVVNFAP